MTEEYLNIRHYYAHRYTDETDDGVFQVIPCHIRLLYPSKHDMFTTFHVMQQVYYNKIRDDTRLRVNFLTSLLGHNEVADQCKRFFITFDGHECGNPHPIDWVTYSSQTGDMRRNANSTYVQYIPDYDTNMFEYSDNVYLAPSGLSVEYEY